MDSFQNKTIAVVPARSGSKGVPDKNIHIFAGKTLLEHAVDVGLSSKCVDTVFVSTDSKHYANIARSCGAEVPFLRPPELSNDKATTKEVVAHLLKFLRVTSGNILLLQPTSPLRCSEQIEHAFDLMNTSNANAIVGVERLLEPHPNKIKKIGASGFIEPYIAGTTSEVPRQLLPEAFRLTGAFYIVRIEAFLEENSFMPSRTLPFVMNNCVNIDSPFDLVLLDHLLDQGDLDLFFKYGK